LAEKRDLVLMVGHVFLFNAGIVKLKQVISSGEIGALRYLSAIRTNLGPVREDVNAAYDLAAHDISIFNWLLDSVPETVSATGGSYLRPGVEDVVFITLKYPCNVLASIHVSWLNPRKVRQITMVGSRRMVTWDDLDLRTPVAIYDCGASTTPDWADYGEFLRVSMWDSEIRLPKVQMEEPLRVQDRYFLESIRRGHAEVSNGVFSVGVVKVLESVAISIKRSNMLRIEG
jgi:predicted dehydrogenase